MEEFVVRVVYDCLVVVGIEVGEVEVFEGGEVG